MPRYANPVDRTLLGITFILVGVGFFVFSSASIGLLVEGGTRFWILLATQLGSIAIGGVLVFLIVTRVPPETLRRIAPILFLISVVLTALVFIPGLGLSLGGARRWIDLGITTFQPGEVLKGSFVLYLAALLTKADLRRSLRILSAIGALLVIPGVILLTQPDTDTFAVMIITALGMFLVAGGKKRYAVAAIFFVIVAGVALVATRPYLEDRIKTFLNPSRDPLGSGYQIQQSYIAIGSGGIAGRGFGKSLQKFQYLPEPIGDSIFAVAAEEFGFIGSTMLIVLFCAFALRGLSAAREASNRFSGLAATGIVILITASAFINIAAMTGLVPLSGLPLPFVSHGGTAMMVTLAEVGVLLSLTRQRR